MIKYTLGILITLYACNICLAQQKQDTLYQRLDKVPVFGLSYFNYGNSDFESPIGTGEAKMQEMGAMFQYIKQLKNKKWLLANKLLYTYFKYDAKSAFNGFDINENFHSISYSLGVIRILPKRWKLIVLLSPTLASDFQESLSRNDLISQGSIIATKRASPYFEYGFGLTYTTRFGNPTVLPLVNLTYKKGDWHTKAVLPAYITHYYVFNENTKLGFRVAAYGNLYNATIENNSTAFELNRVGYSRINIGPDFQTKLFRDFYMNLGAGISTRNVLEIQDDDLNTIIDVDVDEKFFFNIGVKLLK
ncbi:MAG: hypothetical protein HRT67_09930 [Flavobacteriaceae bacterium]|nr:hypothetical protein [Flavobacteriaceae bacterium]